MPTATETTTAIQDKVFAGMQASQKAAVESVRSWAETVESVYSKLPELAFSTPVPPSQVLENAFGFTEKLLANQREFLNQLLEAALPATRAGTASAQSAKTAPPRS
ncbi:MAG: hypothetical protein ACRD1D_12175 [Acidimicrobiales bacterium]